MKYLYICIPCPEIKEQFNELHHSLTQYKPRYALYYYRQLYIGLIVEDETSSDITCLKLRLPIVHNPSPDITIVEEYRRMLPYERIMSYAY